MFARGRIGGALVSYARQTGSRAGPRGLVQFGRVWMSAAPTESPGEAPGNKSSRKQRWDSSAPSTGNDMLLPLTSAVLEARRATPREQSTSHTTDSRWRSHPLAGGFVLTEYAQPYRVSTAAPRTSLPFGPPAQGSRIGRWTASAIRALAHSSRTQTISMRKEDL